jgi:hypothetical protein
MRRKHLVALAVLFPLSALAGRTTVVLVGTTPTTMPRVIGRQGMLIENRGPNPIYCSFDAAVTTTTGHVVAAGEKFPYNGPDYWYCVAGTAQVSGAGTIVSEA